MRSLLLTLALLSLTVASTRAEVPQLPDSLWPEYQYNEQNDATFSSPAWRVNWKRDLLGPTNGGMSIVGDSLYVESFAKKLYAIDAETGALRWSHDLGNIAMGAPVVVDGIVIVGTGNNSMYKTGWLMGNPHGDDVEGFAASNGQLLWTFHTVGENMATGVYVLVGDRPEYVFSNGDNHAYALDPRDGKLLWMRDTLGINAMADLTAENGEVYGIAEYSWQRKFDDATIPGDSPSKVWSWTWALNPERAWFDWRAPYGVADAGPVIGDGNVFIQDVELVTPTGAEAVRQSRQIGWQPELDRATWATHLMALNAATGKPEWQFIAAPGIRSSYTSGTFATAGAVVDHTLYQPFQISRELAAFNTESGKLKWKIPTRAPVKMVPVIKAGRLYAGDTAGNLYVVDITNGAIIHSIKFPTSFEVCPPIIVGNTIFLVNGESLYALDVDSLTESIKLPT